MAASKVETQILWSSSNTKTLNSNNWFVSDEVTLDDSDWDGIIYARADNSGTPASGDTVDIRILYTAGDVDNGGGGNDYADVNTSGSTAARANVLMFLDTYNNYDPDTSAAPINLSGKKFKIAARAPQGGSRSIVLALRLVTHRGAIA